MRILIFHPARLPPKDYGGTERVVVWLARALKELGHRVGVVCTVGSQLPDGIETIVVEGDERSAERYFRDPKRGQAWDLIHFMAPPGASFLAGFSRPYLVTVHGNGKPGEVFPPNTVFVSANHAERHGRRAFVHNGIDPNEYRFSERKGNTHLFLSKTSWAVKNLSGAMDLAAAAKFKLAIAGGSRPVALRLRAFFAGHKWVGPVSGAPKAELLAMARSLVFPVLWDEPFGLVVVEALVSGTPVFAPARGSLPELVPESVGTLYSPDASIAERVDRFAALADKRPRDCEEWVRARFTHLHMGRAYVNCYQNILDHGGLVDAAPVDP